MAAVLSSRSLDVEEIGAGPRVLFVHGSVLGRPTWQQQRKLADEFAVVLPHRPGFGESAPLERGDFEAEAPLFAQLLGDGAHLVGHSYGAVIALYAAALLPGSVRSLTLSEPGCLRIAADEPAVDLQIARGETLYAQAARLTPEEFLRAFRAGAGSLRATPERLEGELLEGVRQLMSERPPWQADPPLQQLAREDFPKLVISGAHSPVFEAVCDRLASAIGARRAILSGRAHSIPAVGRAYNELLRAFLQDAELREAARAR